LERQVLLESGHRCAIHACRQHPVEIAHIIPWSQSRERLAANLIALCPTCHTRYDRREIDRKSMLTYKRNSWLQSQPYSDLEKRILLQMAHDDATEVWIFGHLRLLLSSAINDQLIIDTGATRPSELPETLRERQYKLTESGIEIVRMLAQVKVDSQRGGV